MPFAFHGGDSNSGRTMDETHTIVVGSGKGGVGKSVVSILLAAAVASEGRRVLLVDADQSLANLHVLLDQPAGAAVDPLLRGATRAIDQVRHVAENLWLLPGVSGAEALYAMNSRDRARLHHRLLEAFGRYDAVVVDAGAGIESVVRVATLGASRLLVVTAPEPTALTDAYALLEIVHLQLPGLRTDVLVNRCADAEEGRHAFVRLATACEMFLEYKVRYLGALPEDPAIRFAVQDPARLLETVAGTAAAHTLRDTILPHLDLPETARSSG